MRTEDIYYKKGQDDYHDGKGRCCNPYDKEQLPGQHVNWDFGWLDEYDKNKGKSFKRGSLAVGLCITIVELERSYKTEPDMGMVDG